MTRDEITKLAREAGFVGIDAQHGALSRFAALVAAAEREPVAYKVSNGWVNIALYERQIDADNYAKDQQKRHDLSGSLAHFCVVPLYTAPPGLSMPDADLVRDAERYRWLRASIWYVGPDDLYADEAGGLENYQNENFSAENLDTKIDAAIERDKKGGAA